MKAYRITGWRQYKTDCATPIDETRIAHSPEEALKQMTGRVSKDVRLLLEAQELK